MKNVDYVFNPKAVKMLDNHSLIVLMLSLESLKKDFLAKAENETDKLIILLYLKELIEEVLSEIEKRKIVSFE